MSRTSDRHYQRKRSALKKPGVLCVLCTEEIDLLLRWPDPQSFSADHVEAVALGGHNRGALQPMHLDCNRKRGVKDLESVRHDPHSRAHY